MIKVGEHITLDFLGVKKDYPKSFYEKIIYKITMVFLLIVFLNPKYTPISTSNVSIKNGNCITPGNINCPTKYQKLKEIVFCNLSRN